ncbi:uncharacterized protein LOC129761705 [Toxorhynchites rutilus septentrionalis]|uniref:uncharacterized protein LOC129761705 n=1 Tax=Toxorhynchites rutilus septentrionalis TaxID=329112 RepID=UPI0024789A1E|nr:uncharacterized protein LOC129761705 [Toxorhynchites rutilus septentrionalis]
MLLRMLLKKSLRDTFGKELRKVPEGRSGDAGPLNFESHTSWPYYESMLFLMHQMRPGSLEEISSQLVGEIIKTAKMRMILRNAKRLGDRIVLLVVLGIRKHPEHRSMQITPI